MNAHHHGDGRVDGRDLLERDEIREHVEPETVILLRQQHSEEAQLAELGDHARVEMLFAIPLVDVRRDLAFRELAGDALDLALFFSEWG